VVVPEAETMGESVGEVDRAVSLFDCVSNVSVLLISDTTVESAGGVSVEYCCVGVADVWEADIPPTVVSEVEADVYADVFGSEIVPKVDVSVLALDGMWYVPAVAFD
jgi:hypothetical protein